MPRIFISPRRPQRTGDAWERCPEPIGDEAEGPTCGHGPNPADPGQRASEEERVAKTSISLGRPRQCALPHRGRHQHTKKKGPTRGEA